VRSSTWRSSASIARDFIRSHHTRPTERKFDFGLESPQMKSATGLGTPSPCGRFGLKKPCDFMRLSFMSLSRQTSTLVLGLPGRRIFEDGVRDEPHLVNAGLFRIMVSLLLSWGACCGPDWLQGSWRRCRRLQGHLPRVLRSRPSARSSW